MFRSAIWSFLIIPGTLLGMSAPTAQGQAPEWTPPAWVMDQAAIDVYRRTEKSKPANLNALKANPANAAQLAVGSKLVHFYVSQLLLPANQNLPKDVTDRFLGDLLGPGISEPVRKGMLKEVATVIPTLMDHPEPLVRMNAVLFLSYCSEDKGAPGIPPTPPRPVVQNRTVLGAIAKDRNQPWIVRNTAVLGLQRMLQDGTTINHPELTNPVRSDIATDLLQVLSDALELKTSDPESWWYRMRVVDALGYTERIDLTSGQAAIAEALLERIADPNEHFIVRSQAAVSLSQLPWTAAVNEPLVMEAVGNLIVDLAAAQAKSPRAPVWKQCFGRVYLAFRPKSQLQANRKWGFLFKTSPVPTATNSLWKAAFPILKPFIESKDPPPAIADTAVAPVQKLLETKVANRKIHPQTTFALP